MTTPTTPANPDPSAKIPPAPAPAGPKNVTVKAGKTFILLNGTTVTMLKSATADTRIFTDWTVNTYPDLATAQAAITANKWTYIPPAPSK